MAPPNFIVAFVWEGSAHADGAAKMIEGLADSLDVKAAGMSVVRKRGLAALKLNLEFSLYSRGLLTRFGDMAKHAGAHFVEFLRIPAEMRDKFEQQFLRPDEGAPESFDSFILASRAVRKHLSGGEPAPAPAAPSPRPPDIQDRKAPRFSCELGVEFKTAEEFVKEYATNISKGGLFVRTKARPLLNSEAMLSLQLPDGQKLQTLARVVHVLDHAEHGGVGLAFPPGNTPLGAALEKYLATLGKPKS